MEGGSLGGLTGWLSQGNGGDDCRSGFCPRAAACRATQDVMLLLVGQAASRTHHAQSHLSRRHSRHLPSADRARTRRLVLLARSGPRAAVRACLRASRSGRAASAALALRAASASALASARALALSRWAWRTADRRAPQRHSSKGPTPFRVRPSDKLQDHLASSGSTRPRMQNPASGSRRWLCDSIRDS